MGLGVGTLTPLTHFFVEKTPCFTLATISLFTDVPGAARARAGGRAMSRATCKSAIAWGISHFPPPFLSPPIAHNPPIPSRARFALKL